MTMRLHPMQPNLDEARRFLNILDPDTESFTFQTFSESASAKAKYVNGKQDQLARQFHGSLDRCAKTLASKNNLGAGVFVMVNAGDGKGRKTGNVQRVRAVFADFDGSSPNLAIASIPNPHMVIQSSESGHHVYWLVRDCEREHFKVVQGQISTAFGSDPKPKDLPRVMRLPGFYHMKRKPAFVELLSTNAAPPHSVESLRFLKSENGIPLAQANAGFSKVDPRWESSENWRTLSPMARDLFMIALRRYNGSNNGDISLAQGIVSAYEGWKCRQTASRWRQVLLERGWLQITRQGKPTLYALTIHKIDDIRYPNGRVKIDVSPTKFASDLWDQWKPMSRQSDTQLKKAA